MRFPLGGLFLSHFPLVLSRQVVTTSAMIRLNKKKFVVGVMLGKELSRHVGHKTFYVFKTMCVFSIAELKPFQHFRGKQVSLPITIFLLQLQDRINSLVTRTPE